MRFSWILVTLVGCEITVDLDDKFDDTDTDTTTVTTVTTSGGVQISGGHDFAGEVDCTDVHTVVVTNTSGSPAQIDDIALTSTEGWLSLDAASLPALPYTLDAGATLDIDVTFGASDPGAESGSLSVTLATGGPLVADFTGTADWAGLLAEEFEAQVGKVDVIFLIDQSCSMAADNEGDVERGIPDFIDTLNLNNDWQMAMVNDDNGCLAGGIVNAETPNVEQLLIENAFTGSVGNQYLTENLLQLASGALAQTGPGQCNEGLLRPAALLHIIAMSDEDEQSGRTAAHWLADFESYAPTVVSAVVDVTNSCGDFSGGGEYLNAVNATDGIALNICNANWGANMADLTLPSIGASNQLFVLAQPAVASTLQIRVDGVPTVNFTYDEVTRELILLDEIAEGSEVEVEYSFTGTCL